MYRRSCYRFHCFPKLNFQSETSARDECEISKKIKKLCREGLLKEAVDLVYLEHPDAGTNVFPSICTAVLKRCIDSKAVSQGRRFHLYIVKSGFRPRTFLQNRLLEMYCKCGDLENARKLFESMSVRDRDVFSWTSLISGFAKTGQTTKARQYFDQMPHRDVVSWNALLTGYVECGEAMDALDLFVRMLKNRMEPDHFTFTTILHACRDLQCAVLGKAVHVLSVKLGFTEELSVGNSLVIMYGECEVLDDAFQVFEEMPSKSVMSWVSLMTACIQCDHVNDARQIFGRIPERNVVAWNAMISGYEQHGCEQEALELFQEMSRSGTKPDLPTLVSVLCACNQMGLEAMHQGKQVHGYGIKSGFDHSVLLSNALITFYGSCGDVASAKYIFETTEKNTVSWNAMIGALIRNRHLEIAHNLFLKMQEKNLISWAAIITGYSHQGLCHQSLRAFAEMQKKNIKADQLVFGSVISACAGCAALAYGRQIHGFIYKMGMVSQVVPSNSLITMYSKCGITGDAGQVFRSMQTRDIVSWNSIMAGYAQNGYGKETLLYFEEMQAAEMMPDEVTFIAVLSACSHAGLVEEGWHYFHLMNDKYGISPTSDHYTCMVDLLGRAGQFEHAVKLIESMPFKADACVSNALLGACTIHTNMQ